MAEVKITDDNFAAEVLKSDKPVLVDFWAPWCGPCRVQGPIVEALAKELTAAKVGKLNVDENPKTAEKYGVMSIPTLIIFKAGQVAAQMVGVQTKEALKQKLAS